jgi:hypothetical protein
MNRLCHKIGFVPTIFTSLQTEQTSFDSESIIFDKKPTG